MNEDCVLVNFNGDDTINASNALLVLQYLMSTVTFDDNKLSTSDINSDGKTDVADALLILRYSVNKITEF